MIFGAILAGGTGQRMQNAAMPKQFLMLKEKPIIIYTLEKFLACENIDEVYIGIHRDWQEYMNDLIAGYVPNDADRIHVVCGGSDRNSTLFNVIDSIESKHGESDDDFIITHDAVRPFVTRQIIEENIALVRKTGAVATGIPSKDTIMESFDGNNVALIPDRKIMYLAQTPQSFNMKLLKELYMSLSEDEKAILTDACRICIMREHQVSLVMGDELNIKITTPGDLKIAQLIADSMDR